MKSRNKQFLLAVNCVEPKGPWGWMLECEITLLLYNVELDCIIFPLSDMNDEEFSEFSTVYIISITYL